MGTLTGAARGDQVLRLLGDYLDDDRQLRAYRGGVVMPGRADSKSLTRQMEGGDEDEQETGPGRDEPRSGRGATGRRPAGRQGAAGSSSPFVSTTNLTTEVEADLQAAADAYPQVQVATAAEVAWLHLWVQPVPGLRDSAYLLTQYPFDRRHPVRTWAWWKDGVWIGPRHTNYPHGDICAYEPPDDTWARGDSLVTLLDLKTVWIVRHLYLRFFGRWPGRQVLHTAYERLREQKPGELCGCGSMQLYSECHQPQDRQMNPARALRQHRRRVGDVTRSPPRFDRKFPSPDDLNTPVTP